MSGRTVHSKCRSGKAGYAGWTGSGRTGNEWERIEPGNDHEIIRQEREGQNEDQTIHRKQRL